MILDKLLKKLGAKSYLDLNEEERKTYKEWESALNGKRLTDDDVSEFLEAEKERCTLMILDPKTPEDVDRFYKVQLDTIRRIQHFVSTPNRERQMVERQIEAIPDPLP